MTTAQAADKTGLTPRHVARLCKEGVVKGAEQFGRNWMVPASFSGTRRNEARSARRHQHRAVNVERRTHAFGEAMVQLMHHKDRSGERERRLTTRYENFELVGRPEIREHPSVEAFNTFRRAQ